MLTFTDQLLAVAEEYRSREGIELSAVSSRVFDDSKRLPLISAGGASITLKRAEQALLWFSEHWPERASWPESVPRPTTPAPVGEAA